MKSSTTQLPLAEGLGSVSQAPNLPSGFTDTFTDRYVDIGAGVRRTRSSAATASRCC